MIVELKPFVRTKWVFMHSQKLKETHKWSESLKQNMLLCFAWFYGFILS